MKNEFVNKNSKPVEWQLNPKQERFLESKINNLCYWSGRGAGKSLAVVLKIIRLAMEYPNNYGLLGRYNYSDLRTSTEKDFFDICPPDYIRSYNKQEKQVTFINNSQLIFKGLKDIAKTEVRSMNLGFAVLEQGEEIGEELVNELTACLRRKVYDYDGKLCHQQFIVLCNPEIGWIYRKFYQEVKNVSDIPWVITDGKDYELIQGSMLDNAVNLTSEYLKRMLAMPKAWQDSFVYGKIGSNLQVGTEVFPMEYIEQQVDNTRTQVRKIDGIDIFHEPTGHIYQIGIDPSEGANDPSAIKCVDTFTGEEAASWVSRIQPDLLAHKIVRMADIYHRPKLVLEMNGIGMATLTKLKELNYENIYIREEFDKHAKIYTKKLGWRTTHASKPLLAGHFIELISNCDKKGNPKVPFVKIRDRQCLEEMRTFHYSGEAKNRGMGAKQGFHDDRIMALMLAYWDIKGEKIADSEKLVVAPFSETFKDEDFLTVESMIEYLENKGQARNWLEI